MDRETLQQRISALERQLAEAQARLPRHSTPPRMLMEIEELEDELARLRRDLARLEGAREQP